MPPKADQTLSSCRRLKQRTDFERALHATDSHANKWFSVHTCVNTARVARLGIIASKRAIPNAAARNFAKRMIREVFRCNFPGEKPLDVVVRAKRQFNSEVSAEGRLALIQLLQATQK